MDYAVTVQIFTPPPRHGLVAKRCRQDLQFHQHAFYDSIKDLHWSSLSLLAAVHEAVCEKRRCW
jgi:hypothetical protein